jgi:hypothetical protein
MFGVFRRVKFNSISLISQDFPMTVSRFSANDEFYEFVDHVSFDLNELGFSEASHRLTVVLHEVAWTTSTELFGEIKVTLEKLKALEGERLPQCLSEDVDLCLKTINDVFGTSNS